MNFFFFSFVSLFALFLVCNEIFAVKIKNECKINDEILQRQFDDDLSELIFIAKPIQTCGIDSFKEKRFIPEQRYRYRICLNINNLKIPNLFNNVIIDLDAIDFVNDTTFEIAFKDAVQQVCLKLQQKATIPDEAKNDWDTFFFIMKFLFVFILLIILIVAVGLSRYNEMKLKRESIMKL